MKNKRIPLLLLLVLILPFFGSGQIKTVSLNQGWSFCDLDSNVYFSATVPGSVVTDLVKLNKIPNPFIGANESKVQWIADKSWCYRKSFTVDKVDFAKFKCAELVFEGIDTYVSVYLNDSLIYQADNMFVPHKIKVKKWLKIGKNELKVVFPPLLTILKSKAKQLSYTLPENERVFARKAQFHFGWDWAPKILSLGLFKPVYLNFWNTIKVNKPIVITSLNNGLGEVACKIPVLRASRQPMDLMIKVTDELANEIYIQQKFSLLRDSIFELNFKIKNPKIWNPSGNGESNLYHFKILVSTAKGEKFEFHKQVGFRAVSLVQTPDSIGSSFYFKVNGQPVFAKGANWTPMEFLPHQNTPEKYRKLLNMAHDAGYNMLRVWGGGWYEDDAFYDICDSLGIMVWQDAMFACTMYPFDKDYLNNVSNEIQFQSQRLSSHPSLVLWCGNNENYEGWFNWGWQKQFGYSAADSAAIWNGNRQLFETVIPQVLKQTYGNIDFNYHPSSPANGWGRDTAYKSGDVHYWGVWWGMEPFSSYPKKVGRFVSEYGFQGYPDVKTLRYGANQPIESLSQPSVAAHQKHSRGFQTIEEYMQRDYPKPTNVADYIYLSQLMQADGVGEALKAHRVNVSYCMGSLFWQFSDCWSSISWSAVDYFARPKQFYFATKRLFEPVRPIFIQKENTTEIWVSNIDNKPFEGSIVLIEIDQSGAKRVIETSPVSMGSNSSSVVSVLLESRKKPNSVLCALLLNTENGLVARDICFGNQPKDLKLKKPTISYKQSNGVENTINLIISTEVPVKGLWLDIDNFQLSDNGFDLVPGIDIYVSCKPERPNLIFSIDAIQTTSLNDVMNK